MAAAEAWARERGATELRLDAWEFAAGPLPFYESLGYQTIKRTLVKPLAQDATRAQG
jgi:GNAT superfamily N-acetyltransferase